MLKENSEELTTTNNTYNVIDLRKE